MALKDEKTMLSFKTVFVLTNQDLVDILSCALEGGGIAYWCDHVDPIGGHYYGGNACEHVARGGQLLINLTEGPIEKGGPDNYTLTRGKLLRGISMFLGETTNPYDYLYQDGTELRLEACNADAEACDEIIQYALFNEIVFS